VVYFMWIVADGWGISQEEGAIPRGEARWKVKDETKSFAARQESHENTTRSNRVCKDSRSRRADRPRMDGRTCKIWAKSMRKGTFKKELPTGEPL
jgi:hypothetical protein